MKKAKLLKKGVIILALALALLLMLVSCDRENTGENNNDQNNNEQNNNEQNNNEQNNNEQNNNEQNNNEQNNNEQNNNEQNNNEQNNNEQNNNEQNNNEQNNLKDDENEQNVTDNGDDQNVEMYEIGYAEEWTSGTLVPPNTEYVSLRTAVKIPKLIHVTEDKVPITVSYGTHTSQGRFKDAPEGTKARLVVTNNGEEILTLKEQTVAECVDENNIYTQEMVSSEEFKNVFQNEETFYVPMEIFSQLQQKPYAAENRKIEIKFSITSSEYTVDGIEIYVASSNTAEIYFVFDGDNLLFGDRHLYLAHLYFKNPS